MNRPTLKPEQITVTTSRLLYPCASPLEPCALLYLLPRTTPFCIDLPPCTACCRPLRNVHSCLRSRPFHAIRFLIPFLRLLTRAVITRYTSLPASPRSLLHVIHISTIDTTRIQSLSTIFLIQCCLLSVTLCRLDFRCPSGHPSRIHPFTSCRNIHMSLTCIPYIASKPRSASKSASTLTVERTSLHLLDPVPSSASSVFVLSLLFLFLWDLSIGNGRKRSESLLFIIVVIVYLQYLEEKWKEKRRIAAYIILVRLANASHDNLRILDARSRSRRWLPYAFRHELQQSRNQRRRSRSKASKTPTAVVSGIRGPCRDKQGQALRAADLHPNPTRLPKVPSQ